MSIPDPVALYKNTLAAGSHAVIDSRVKLLAFALGYDEPRQIKWSALDYEQCVEAVSVLRGEIRAERLSAATVSATIIALRKIVRECQAVGLLPKKTAKAILGIKTLKSAPAMAGRALESDEMTRLFRFPTRELRDYRDKAILAVLFGTGVRRAEMAALDLDSLTVNEEMLALTVRHGKGDKSRIVYLPDDAVEHLNHWLDQRGEHEGAMFQRIIKGGALLPESRLSAQAIYLICLDRAKRANIQAFTPHDARRTVITELLDHTDPVTVADIVGHEDVNTTRRYDRRKDRAMRQVAKGFPIRLR